MTIQNHGQQPAPAYSRIHRANEPRLRHPIPALDLPIQNANQTLNRVAATLYRGGSSPGNPITWSAFSKSPCPRRARAPTAITADCASSSSVFASRPCGL